MKKILIDWLLLILAAVFFALSHPNILFVEGFPIFAYIAIAPLFILTRRVRFPLLWLYGLIYGTMSYGFFVYWLADYHPLGLPVISALYGLQCMLLLPVLRMAWIFCGKYGWLTQWFVWCAYDYLKTTGFSGFSYGNIGYTHWQVLPLLQFASIAGVWGLGALITFVSAWLSKVLNPLFEVGTKKDSNVPVLSIVKTECIAHRKSMLIWISLFVAILVWGFVVQKDYSNYPTKTVALIQPNSDPWKGGIDTYTRDLNTLKRMTNAALREDDGIDFVVWSETAFVPSIRLHYQYREIKTRIDLVNDLLGYIDSKNVPFIIGNGDVVREKDENGLVRELSYNAAFLFRPGENVIPPEPEAYYKMHLVPYTEHFPYKEQLPMVYNALIENDTHFWEKGTEANLFSVAGVNVGTPICFEDTFGYIGRRFAQNGAQALVNLSNDAWSHSEVAQYQHLAMAAFRSVENRIPSVRATASGQTAVIDPNGNVTAMAEAFEEAYLIAEFPVIEAGIHTLYTRWGDYIGVLSVILSAIALVSAVCFSIVKKMKK